MFATLPPPADTLSYPSLRTHRSSYEQVAVCPEWVGFNDLTVRSALPRPAYWYGGGVASRTATEDLPIRWLLNKVLKDGEMVRPQLATKQAHLEGIDPRHIMATTYLLSLVLWKEASSADLTFTLTYDQSMHVRAALPHGSALHVSVLFTPGLDPRQYTGKREEEDNTVVSLFGPDGRWRAGAEGPLMDCLERLPALLVSAV